MKHSLYLWVLLFLTYKIKMTLSQYIPIATQNIKWTERIQSISSSEYTNYSFTGDTIIGTKTYKKFVEHSTYGYIGAIRNDSANKKVYCVYKGKSTEKLMYDFNVNVGDTTDYIYFCHSNYYLYGDSARAIVHSKDSVWDGTKYRERWYMKYIFYTYGYPQLLWYFPIWIEGMGCVNNFANIMVVVCPTPYMTCYQENSTVYIEPCYSGSTLNNSSSYTNCIDYQNYLILNIKDKSDFYNTLQLYPNPIFKTQGDVFLSNANNFVQIKVIDVEGKTIQDINTIQNINALSVQNWKSGVYYIQGIDKYSHRVHTQKLVVIE
ncbi:MAG: T9SS type A sorting domain-containing protein [Bacteroidia bacterium]|nr:T9SS type A sorting domain-containing protein [Bacteroidia bacterium]MDW8345693.1 T9SS type A sorting domain-containing protein [Bacteroidia bacterium]